MIMPVMAVGTGTGAIYLVSVSTQQVPCSLTASPGPMPGCF